MVNIALITKEQILLTWLQQQAGKLADRIPYYKQKPRPSKVPYQFRKQSVYNMPYCSGAKEKARRLAKLNNLKYKLEPGTHNSYVFFEK